MLYEGTCSSRCRLVKHIRLGTHAKTESLLQPRRTEAVSWYLSVVQNQVMGWILGYLLVRQLSKFADRTIALVEIDYIHAYIHCRRNA